MWYHICGVREVDDCEWVAVHIGVAVSALPSSYRWMFIATQSLHRCLVTTIRWSLISSRLTVPLAVSLRSGIEPWPSTPLRLSPIPDGGSFDSVTAPNCLSVHPKTISPCAATIAPSMLDRMNFAQNSAFPLLIPSPSVSSTELSPQVLEVQAPSASNMPDLCDTVDAAAIGVESCCNVWHVTPSYVCYSTPSVFHNTPSSTVVPQTMPADSTSFLLPSAFRRPSDDMQQTFDEQYLQNAVFYTINENYGDSQRTDEGNCYLLQKSLIRSPIYPRLTPTKTCYKKRKFFVCVPTDSFLNLLQLQEKRSIKTYLIFVTKKRFSKANSTLRMSACFGLFSQVI